MKPKEREGCVVCMCGTNELLLLRIEATSEMKRRERGREREEKDSKKRQREGRQRGREEQREGRSMTSALPDARKRKSQ